MDDGWLESSEEFMGPYSRWAKATIKTDSHGLTFEVRIAIKKNGMALTIQSILPPYHSQLFSFS
jgi:hypothetical protein